ncbi:MAG TPA: hypothetical protein PKW95_00775 [bacterium]|nr:hypothetical protein [bacterium]
MLPRRKLGELLVERGLITAEQLQDALTDQSRTGSRVGSTLVKMAYIKEQDLLRFLSLYYDVPEVDLLSTSIAPAAVNLIPADKAKKWRVIAFRIIERPPDKPLLFIATPDPTDFDMIEKVRTLTGYEIEEFVCTHGSFEWAYERVYGPTSPADDVAQLLENAEVLPLAKAVATLLVEKNLIDIEELRDALREAEEETGE